MGKSARRRWRTAGCAGGISSMTASIISEICAFCSFSDPASRPICCSSAMRTVLAELFSRPSRTRMALMSSLVKLMLLLLRGWLR